MVSVDSSLTATLTGENDLAMVGGRRTFKVALEAARLVPPLEASPLAAKVFTYAPAVAEVTLTVMIQVLFAGMVAPARASEGPLFAAVTVPSGHVVAPPGAAVFTIPAG